MGKSIPDVAVIFETNEEKISVGRHESGYSWLADIG